VAQEKYSPSLCKKMICFRRKRVGSETYVKQMNNNSRVLADCRIQLQLGYIWRGLDVGKVVEKWPTMRDVRVGYGVRHVHFYRVFITCILVFFITCILVFFITCILVFFITCIPAVHLFLTLIVIWWFDLPRFGDLIFHSPTQTPLYNGYPEI